MTEADLANLTTIRSNILTELATLGAVSEGDSYSIDGQSVTRDRMDKLLARLEKLDALLAAAEPYEIISHGFTDGGFCL